MMPRQKGQKAQIEQRLYIAGEQFRYDWREADVREFIASYNDLRSRGTTGPGIIADLSKVFKRPPPEIAVLIIDLGERGFIGPDGKASNPRTFRIADCE